MSAQGPKVVLVGHCGFDASQLSRIVRTAAPDAEIAHAESDADIEVHGSSALFLVNRALPGRFSAPDGVALIATVRANTGAACMLISNYEDAQQRAIDAGALPGFGKSDDKDEAADRVRAALALNK
ncbi:MAG: hypothetical protein H6812_07150 [Phycisphaeraceae bacterium]|nr:hypothetical protein [Phycisphaerales bacterium]MCB9843018.1 hypothetical protein [Phycisphaeraceae bacterium]